MTRNVARKPGPSGPGQRIDFGLAGPRGVCVGHRCYRAWVQLRYNFRVYPTPGQRMALARAFGCARVVYNDNLRAREEAHAAGVKLSDTDIQRRVVTDAKRTPARAWLAEVSSVVLV